jgi:signal transduction histidine kinase
VPGAEPRFRALTVGRHLLAAMRERLEGKQYVEGYVHALTHELKSPLAGIRGSAEMIEAGGEAMPAADLAVALPVAQVFVVALAELQAVIQGLGSDVSVTGVDSAAAARATMPALI